jgi:DNA-directed RNA polymerase specialized sigma24 family protein
MRKQEFYSKLLEVSKKTEIIYYAQHLSSESEDLIQNTILECLENRKRYINGSMSEWFKKIMQCTAFEMRKKTAKLIYNNEQIELETSKRIDENEYNEEIEELLHHKLTNIIIDMLRSKISGETYKSIAIKYNIENKRIKNLFFLIKELLKTDISIMEK